MQKYIFFLYLNHRIYKKGRKAVIFFLELISYGELRKTQRGLTPLCVKRKG